MKKFLIVLGSIFLAIVVLAAIGIGFVAVRGNALDKESKAYADTAIPAIINGWSEKELLDRASPEFKQAVTQQQLDEMFHWFGSLGRFQKYDPPLTPSLLVSDRLSNGGAIPVGRSFTERGVFTIEVVRRQGTALILRFRWLPK